MRRYYEDDFASLTLDYGPDWSIYFDSNFVALDKEFHKIKIQINIGIYSWVIDNSQRWSRSEFSFGFYEIIDKKQSEILK